MKTAALAYTPYGYIDRQARRVAMFGFNGDRYDPLTGNYPLGQGYRSYSPTLMRFHKPDALSPFGLGGFNAYAYCNGDPLNYRDDTGQARTFAQLQKFWAVKVQSAQPSVAPLKPVPKKKVTFNKKVTGTIYTNEHDVQTRRLIQEKQSLQAYIGKFTQRVERKKEDFKLLIEPSTSDFAKKWGISEKRYQVELNALATWINDAQHRLKNLNATLRSYRV